MIESRGTCRRRKWPGATGSPFIIHALDHLGSQWTATGSALRIHSRLTLKAAALPPGVGRYRFLFIRHDGLLLPEQFLEQGIWIVIGCILGRGAIEE